MAALAVLASCSSRPLGTSPTAGMPQPPRGSAVYDIDASSSELRLLVYAGGALARLGHNHVILNRDLQGWVSTSAIETAFWLQVPTRGFVVDDAEARRAAGPDFADEVSDEAKAGTVHNMLGAALLDADRYPDITVQSLTVVTTAARDASPGAAGPPNTLAAMPGPADVAASEGSATVSIRVAGKLATVVVPFTVQRSAGLVSARGGMVLRQSQLGLTPFSVMLGALQVRDDMHLEFTLVARAH